MKSRAFTTDQWRIIRDALTEEKHRLSESHKRPSERSEVYAERRADRIRQIEDIRDQIPA